MTNTLKPRSVQSNGVASTDRVVPLSVFDDSIVKRRALICSTLLFDGVLDVQMLRAGLEKLIELKGWNKLGARLRRNHTTGALENHIPVSFTRDRPAIRFYHMVHPTVRAEHPVASKLPSPTAVPTVLGDPTSFQSLAVGPNAPTKLEEYLHRDEPQIGLVVSSFKDSTLVSLSWPHTLFDAVAFGEALHAWSLMLQSRHEEVPEPLEVGPDHLASVGQSPAEPHKLKGSQLSLFGLIVYVCRVLFQLIWYKQQSRSIYIPGPFLRALKAKAIKELSTPLRGDSDVFLSDGDVICAWWAKVNSAHLSTGSSTVIHLANALGWRPAFADDLLPSHRPYLSNAVGLSSLLVPATDVLSQPLSYLASQIRSSIVESRQRQQVEAYAALWREFPGRIPPLFGTPTMHAVACSNWSKAKLFKIDFSAALVEPSLRASRVELRPSYVQSLLAGVNASNGMIVLGEDAFGGYWLTAFTHARHWATIEQAIAQYGGDGS